jgi:fructose/tagatose bisphosphate aldolase
MADGSRLSFEANIEFVRSAASLSKRYGGHVEAELGRIEGNEEIAAAAAAGRLTDPRQVARFVYESRAACLAVSIGNVHGTYAGPPHLDWTRLEEIREVASVPLSLHGASGLDAGDVRRAVGAGINKINVNTELRECYLDTLCHKLDGVVPGARVLDLGTALMEAIAGAVDTKLRMFAPTREDSA